MKIPAWSFSSIKTFEQCPKKFYHLKVARDYKEKETEAMLYGTAFHKAAEEYVRDGTPIPPQFKFAEAALEKLNAMEGEKLCEYEMGLTENLEPCGFKDKDVWWRGIADLMILNGDKAKVIDYKTGKSAKYADRGQLELMALATFKHFPEVNHVKAALMFVISQDFVKAEYSKEDEPRLWEKWLTDYNRMKAAYELDVWNPRTSGLCKAHCVVLECPHNGRSGYAL
jgi:CRISPR/Cas system-associated exonuclease Cas4 (RecB family)